MTRPSCALLLLLALVLGGAGAGCQGDQRAILIVVVTTDDTVSGVKAAQLELKISVEDADESHAYSPGKNKTITFPTTLTAEVYRSADKATLTLTAKDKDGAPLAQGQA